MLLNQILPILGTLSGFVSSFSFGSCSMSQIIACMQDPNPEVQTPFSFPDPLFLLATWLAKRRLWSAVTGCPKIPDIQFVLRIHFLSANKKKLPCDQGYSFPAQRKKKREALGTVQTRCHRYAICVQYISCKLSPKFRGLYLASAAEVLLEFEGEIQSNNDIGITIVYPDSCHRTEKCYLYAG